MPVSLEQALQLSTRLVAVSVALQALELFVVRDALTDTGIFRFATLSPELDALPFPLSTLSRLGFPYRRFMALLGLALGLSGLLLIRGLSPVVIGLFACALATALRFRGTFNGGSDAMTLLVLLVLSVASLAREGSLIQRAAVGYLGVQTVLSYFVAGVIKLKEPGWRDGSTLLAFLALDKYAAPGWARRLAGHAKLRRVGSSLLLLFECSFPLALLSQRACLAYLGLAVLFHLANALVFGLTRFVLAWMAAYPALYYLSQWGPLEATP